MDLHWLDAAPSEEECAAIDRVLGPSLSATSPGDALEEHVLRGGRESALSKRHLLLPALHAAQDAIGFISKGALNYICQRLVIPPAEAYGVATFYALLQTEPSPPRVAHVCDDIACKLAGADELCRSLEASLGHPGEPGGEGKSSWQRSPCLGQCERGPAVLFQLASEENWVMVEASAKDVESALAGRTSPKKLSISAPQTRTDRRSELRLLRRVGLANPESLDEYREHGGYGALRRAVEIGPEKILREVKESNLRGRGGAAFPMGVKWEAVAKAPVRPHYVVCNADESEPGTFKDRVLMEEDPFAIVESMTIAGFATGSTKGYIYIRGEYPFALARLSHAIDVTRTRGYLGENVMGEGFDFDLEIRKGAGAYICGEETALFNSIEGFRGEPRNKPPFPTQSGLFGKPTVVNNVETLVNVLDIVRDGGPAFARIGTNDSSGNKLFCVSGNVNRPGLYEVPFGVKLSELLEEAGGVPQGREVQAVLLGGAAGAFIGPDELDVPLTFEGTRAIGATLGSGVVMVFDDRADLMKTILRVAAFFRDESCGQCVPCRVGTVRQEEALQRFSRERAGSNGALQREFALIDELAQVMRDASICGLGHTAASAVMSALSRKLL